MEPLLYSQAAPSYGLIEPWAGAFSPAALLRPEPHTWTIPFLIWGIQGISSVLLLLSTSVQVYLRIRSPADERAASPLNAANGTLLVAQGFVITSLLYGIDKLVRNSGASKNGLFIIQVSVSALAVVASLACILLLLLRLSRASRVVFNVAMFTALVIHGGTHFWSFWTLWPCFGYLASIAADMVSDESAILSATTFSFTNPYISRLQGRVGTPEDLPGIPGAIEPEKVYGQVKARGYTSDNELRGFWGLVFQLCRRELTLSFLCELLNIACKFGQPWLLSGLLAARDWRYVVAMLGLGLLDSVTFSQAAYQAKTAGAKLKAGLASSVYEKVLRSTRTETTSVSAVNLVEVDISRVQDFFQYIHAAWSAPFQVTVSLLSLGVILGWVSALAAAASVIGMIPFWFLCNYIMQKAQVKFMARRDARMALTSEVLANADMIKLWAQEPLMESRLDKIRQLELAVFEGLVWVSAMLSMLMRSAPTIVSVVAFLVSVAMHNQLRSENIFPALLFCALLVYPLAMIPVALGAYAGCAASYGRVRTFCGSENDNTEDPLAPRDDPNILHTSDSAVVSLEEVGFGWKGDRSMYLLNGVSISVAKGEFIALSGSTSSGKSTILKLILGSIKPNQGRTAINGTVAYMSQEAWLITGTIRDNILFGRDFESDFYQRVFEACALDRDFDASEHGDLLEIGSHGAGLSGGQKSRICLARALYSRADVYLLDDPLAAVDSQVRRHIVDRVLGPQGMLKDKTRVVVSNTPPVLEQADRVLELSHGTIQQIGELGDEDANSAGSSRTPSTATLNNKSDAIVQVISLNGSKMPQQDIPETSPEPAKPIASQGANKTQSHLIQATGLIPLRLYWRWLLIAGPWNWTLMVLFSVLAHLSALVSTYVLKKVADTFGEGKVMQALELYAAAGAIQTIMSCLSLVLGWYLCLKPSSRKLHALLAAGVLRSPMRFFRTTPTGEIMNRFANDLIRHDGPLFGSLFGFLNSLLRVITSLVVLLVINPPSAVIVLPLVVLCWYLLNRCVRVLVETRRLETTSRSPLITNLQETLSGAEIIRVFGQHELFRGRNFASLRKNLRAYMAGVGVELWLTLRLYAIAAVLQSVAAAALLLVGADTSTLGFVMTFMLQLTSVLAQTVMLRTQVECEMVSVQRIFAVADAEPESKQDEKNKARRNPVPASWPVGGKLSFVDFSASYDGDASTTVLKNITLDFTPGQSTAIVGRTGAGKSSFFLSILRILEPTAGSIEIDGLDVFTEVDLPTLRSRVAIIPQNCRAFAGTVRSNLDPNGVHDESDLLRVVKDSLFAAEFSCASEALDHEVAQGGSNLSAGQLQLLAIARCLLLDCNIVLLDEVTSAMDDRNEKLVHEALKTQFRNKTVITVSHRLQSAIDNDRIIVMDAGCAAEVGAPQELFDRGGRFREMALAAGLGDTLALVK